MKTRATRFALVAGLLASGWLALPGGAGTKQGPTTRPTSDTSGAARAEEADHRPILPRLADRVDPVKIEAPAKDAFTWWSRTTGIPLVVNWNALQEQGVDPDTRIDLDLRNVPAGQLLGLLMKQASVEHPLIFEAGPYYIEIMTRDEANKRLVLRSYDIADLLHESGEISVPSFDISNAFESGQSRDRNRTSSSSSGGSDNGSLFGDDDGGSSSSSQRAKTKSPEDRGEEIARIIRDTVEPDVWRENGGNASIRFFQGKLLINAPLYVHSQIGPGTGGETGGVNPARYPRSADAPTTQPTGASRGISAVEKSKPTPVSAHDRK